MHKFASSAGQYIRAAATSHAPHAARISSGRGVTPRGGWARAFSVLELGRSPGAVRAVVRARRSKRERSRKLTRRRRDLSRGVGVGVGVGVERVERVGSRQELDDVGAFGVRWKLRRARDRTRRQSGRASDARGIARSARRGARSRVRVARTSGMASIASSSARWSASARVSASPARAEVDTCVDTDARTGLVRRSRSSAARTARTIATAPRECAQDARAPTERIGIASLVPLSRLPSRPRARSRRTVMIPSRSFAPDIDSTETERETDADAPIGVERR